MKSSGVVTVFLSLILLLFLNFLMTTIEAARITAGRSYLEMLGVNAGNYLESRYYFPLFQEYGLLAMDAGQGSTVINQKKLEADMNVCLKYSEEQSIGGLIKLSESGLTSLQLKTLVSDNYQGFKEQIKAEAVYEGAELLNEFITGNSLESVSRSTALQVQQQKAGEATNAVSIEILKLMELVDGICTAYTGLKTDKNGNYLVADNFVKKFCPHELNEMEDTYGSSVIYERVKERIVHVQSGIESLLQIIKDYEHLKNYVDKESTRTALEKMYLAFYQGWNACITAGVAAAQQAEILEKVQTIARVDVLEYEQKLIEASGMDNEVLAGLFKELDSIKDYVGLNEKGYNAKKIKENLIYNINVLQSAYLPEISELREAEGEIATEEMGVALTNFSSIISCMTYQYLKFDYGNLKASDKPEEKLKGAISKLFSEGIFTLLGVENVSEKTIDGTALPSKGMSTTQTNDIMKLFRAICDDLADLDIGSMLKAGAREMSMDFLTEVYLNNHFTCYGDKQAGRGRVDYEREYILHGKKTDEANLMATALQLVALRAVFCFTALMADAGRNQEAAALAQTMAVFGIPALVYAAKYLILTVWAIEEAVVEVAALFSGKKLPVFNLKGHLKIQELLILSPELVRAKVNSIGNTSAGVGYDAYILILSFLQTDGVKYGRALDLIQENIRYRYNKAFRVGNCLVSASFNINGRLEKRFTQGFFKDEAYEYMLKGGFSY